MRRKPCGLDRHDGLYLHWPAGPWRRVYTIKKKQINYRDFLFGFLILSLLFSGVCTQKAQADDKNYSVRRYDVNVEVQSNGDAVVREQITYQFSGKFNGILRDIDTDQTDGMEDIRVFVEKGDKFRAFHQAKKKGRNAYEMTREDGLVKLKVYETSKDEEKTFRYEYRMRNVAEKYQDIGVYNRKVIDRNWDVPLNNITITIRIPEGASKEDLKIFAHGPLTGESRIADERTFVFHVPEVSPGTFVETLAVFPPGLIPGAGRVHDETKLPAILSNEQKLAEEANTAREEARQRQKKWEKEQKELRKKRAGQKKIRDGLLPVFVAAILAGALSLMDFFAKYARGPRPEFQGDYCRELPGDYPPAVMSYLMNTKYIYSRDIMATLLDLVREKQITIRGSKAESGHLLKRSHVDYEISRVEGAGTEHLLAHEEFLLSWFIDRLGRNGALVLGDLKKITGKRSRALEFNKDFEKFQSMVQAEGKAQGFFSRNSWRENLNGSGRYALIATALLVAGSVAAIQLSSGWGGAVAAVGGITLLSMLLVSVMPKKTQYGAEQAAKWSAFKRFLLHFSEMEKAEIPSIVIWEHYLVYAVSLGIAKEVIEQMPKVFSDGEIQDPGLTYMGYYGSLQNLALMSSMFDSTMDSIDNAVNTAATAASPDSSGSGGGGGFSGGSSGGGGGGGGGGAF